MRRTSLQRRKSGISIVEFAAALVLGLPLVIFILYAMLEASIYFTIRSNLELAGRKAARQLAIEYGKNPAGAQTAATENAVFAQCFIPQFTASVNQFDATWETDETPATVTVVVNYPTRASNSTLPSFPNPDPLNLGGNFEIKSATTFSLE